MRNFYNIQQETYDLIVIGGGVNGAGVARDAALRGLKTILIEKGDFASGTSSWSSRLIHGGLRYLEYFEVLLVRESLREREILLGTAPHLVKPLLLTVPIYRKRSRPYWKIWAGMCLYDLLSYDKTVPPHRMLPQAEFQQIFRCLDPEGLTGGAQYYDGQVTRAERLCWENVLSAKEAGATVLNYVEVMELGQEGDRISQLHCKDTLSGEEFTVSGNKNAVIINTTGPWVDHICQRGSNEAIAKKRKMGGTKGSHILVHRFPGAVDTCLYVEAKSDSRPFFIIPWLDLVLIGTTDLPFTGDLDRVKADDAEIDYLLTETNNIITTANLTRKDVIFTYSGVRPLPYQEGKKPGELTRKHILYDHQKEGVKNMISLIGGKLTTYRHVGEEMVDAAFKKMGASIPPCPTLAMPLPGCILATDPGIQKTLEEYGDRISSATIYHLFSLYGSKGKEVLALTQEMPELADRISPHLPDIKAQIVYAAQVEMAETAVDILRRRTTIALQENYGLNALSTVITVLSEYCSWSQERCDRAISDYYTYMQENCIPDYVLKSKQELINV
ncbi:MULTISPECIES: glycerol-3-phosphate dehydrogenase [Spirulina sp. CCY15215]|uniref:glycerol-3-phosphate dehydrogenase n=1 Tax=Spirulina sp. CCY15215 TaxID=2767591 RepID=UPI00194EAFB5